MQSDVAARSDAKRISARGFSRIRDTCRTFQRPHSGAVGYSALCGERRFPTGAAYLPASSNPVVKLLLDRVDAILADGIVDPEEAIDLFTVLKQFAGGDFELGETLKSTTLPLDNPPPTIKFRSSCFCFTGTFAFGTRKECEAAVLAKGGLCKALTQETSYLVIGAYATESWAHSAFGRKSRRRSLCAKEGRRLQSLQNLIGSVSCARGRRGGAEYDGQLRAATECVGIPAWRPAGRTWPMKNDTVHL